VPEFISNLFRSDFLPHGVCYRWSPEVVWLHTVSDSLIALAYYVIPFALLYITRKRTDLVYPWMFWLFGTFILACGTTHLMSVWVIWHPVYRLDGVVKLITAIASVPTAILLIRLAPHVVAIPSPEQLRVANRELHREIEERRAAEEEIRRLNAQLEKRVNERTRELLETNQRLQESERRVQDILDTAPTLVYMKDLEGRFLFINRKFEQLFRVKREELAGKTDYDIFSSSSADGYRRADQEVMSLQKPLEFEEAAIHDGQRRTYMSVKFPLFRGDRTPYALCGISTDITDRKQAEQALRHYNTQLEQFAFVAAHDLQEPLRSVKNYAQLIDSRYSQKLDTDGRQFLGFIISGVERMSMLVSDLQVYAETANRRDPERSTCDLNEVLQEVSMSLQATITESGAELVSAGLPILSANRRQMIQLFQNLIANAIKYRGARAPRIEIGAIHEAHEWVFHVKDNGIGFEMRYAEQIFGLFKRLHGRQVPGTGMGLAICKQIVEQHHGRIWAESNPGAGSTFSFTLAG
jgi:PAS domain S-box-containing protein